MYVYIYIIYTVTIIIIIIIIIIITKRYYSHTIGDKSLETKNKDYFSNIYFSFDISIFDSILNYLGSVKHQS